MVIVTKPKSLKAGVPKAAIRNQMLAIFPVQMNIFMMGASIGWISNAIYFFTLGHEVSATINECSWIALMSEIGKICFAVPAGILVDKFGRRNIQISAAVLHFISWSTLSFSTSIYAIYVARFLIGMATALIHSSGVISIGELGSSEIRGSLISISHIFKIMGGLFENVISSVFSSYKILSYSTATLSFLYFFTLYWQMETPNHLLSVSKYEKARENFEHVRAGYDKKVVDLEFQKLKDYIEDEKQRKKKSSWLKFVSSKSIRKPIITLALLYLFSAIIGSVTISAYITVIIPENEYISKKHYPLMVQVLSFVTALLTPVYIEKFPRRNIYMVSCVITGILAVFTGLGHYFYDSYQTDFMKWFLLMGNLLIVLVWYAMLKPVNTTLKSELPPQAVKGLASSIAGICQGVGTIIGYKSYIFITEGLGLHYNYLFYTINCILNFFIVYYLLPESRGKYLSDIQVNPSIEKSKSTDTQTAVVSKQV